MGKYLTAPEPTTRMPRGIPYIVGNEAAERFSFYGMKTVLFVFMTQYLLSASGGRDVMTPDEAKEAVHWFVAFAYFFPIVGAIVSDVLLGKYRTILGLSMVYCLGHLVLAMDHTRFYLFLGLALIAVGTGAIKPCVSAHVGDQFGTKNKHLLNKVFGWFYFSINLGAAASTWLTPKLLADHHYGPAWAFGLPGVLMALATLVFWIGRHKFVHIPPAGFESVKQAFSGEGLRAVCSLVPVYLFVAVFWSLFDQTGSAWIQQAKRMDRQWLGVDWLPSQIQAANPILILLFIPLFSYVLYPLVNRVFPLTPLRKVSIGFFITVLAFAVPAWIESQITGAEVVRSTSEGDVENFPAERLLDGKADGSGWASDQIGADGFPQEIVIRLRERKAWPIKAVRINPHVDLSGFLRQAAVGGAEPAAGDASKCWAKDVEIFVGAGPLGDPDPAAAGPIAATHYRWQRKVGEMSLARRDAFQQLDFPPVLAEYILLRIHRAWGGPDAPYVGLGEVEVIAAGELGAGAEPHAAAVWPNVAATGYQPGIVWQLLAYVLMTAAEVMVSITCLEFSYTQAPNKMKSFVMALYMLTVFGGNAFTALVNKFIQNEDQSSKLEGAGYYWFFTAVMFAAALGFILVARTYRGKTYIQGQE